LCAEFFRNNEWLRTDVTFCITNSRVAAVISLNAATPLLTVLNAKHVTHFWSLSRVRKLTYCKVTTIFLISLLGRRSLPTYMTNPDQRTANHIALHTHTHTHTHIHTHTYTNTYTHTHTHIHTQIHALTHTRTHIHTHA
jgi:hypothetical protein